jgi:hypothetical protein
MGLIQAIRRVMAGPQRAAPPAPPLGATRRIRPRIGILFVHGMGQQERGDTLTQMGDAVTEWIRRAVRDDATVDFSIRHAVLRTGEHRASDEEASLGATAHVTIRITDRHDPARTQEWLLAESWWADVFRPATFGETALWTVAVGPSVITGQLVNMVRRLIFEDRSWTHGNVVSLSLLPIRLLVAVALTFIALLAAALLTPLAIFLLVLSIVPVPFVSGFAKSVAANLAGSFGDLLVLVRSPIRFAAMAERVKQDLDLVTSQSDDVIVVAHSQGSAVAWHAIRRVAAARDAAGAGSLPPSTLTRFVSFGQALRKLKALYLFSTEGEPWRTVATGLAGLITLALAGVAWLVGGALATALGGGAPDGASATTVSVLLSIAVVLLVPLAMIVRRNEELAQEKLRDELGGVRRGLGDGFEWLDLWASADPAPNGPIFDELPAGVRSFRIRNSASVLFDHSSYWSNVTEFVSAIVLLAAHRTRPPGISAPAWPSERLRAAARRRARRVTALAVARIVYFTGLVIGLVAFRDELPMIGEEITAWLDGLPLVPDWFSGWSRFALGALGTLAATTVALVVWLVLGAIRSGVLRLDERSLFAGSSGWVAEAAALGWFVVAIAVPWVSAALLGLDVGPLPGALAWHAVLSAAIAVTWAVLQRGGSDLAD